MRIIQFETAKLAKEKWFDNPCRTHYSTDGLLHKATQPITHKSLRSGGCLASYQYELMDWLRVKHNIHIEISIENFTDGYIWQYQILTIGEDHSILKFDGEFKGYNDCLEFALQEALKLI